MSALDAFRRAYAPDPESSAASVRSSSDTKALLGSEPQLMPTNRRSDDSYEVRARSREETKDFLDGEQARRRRRHPDLADIAPAQVPGHLATSGSRRRLAGVRVTATGYQWRWPWPTLEHLDVVDCDLEGVEIKPPLLRSSKFDDCRFEKVAMGGARVGGTTFTACVFENVGLVGIATAEVRSSTFRGSAFTRLDARGVQFEGVTFEDCEIDGLRGRATRFLRCSFVRTRFRGQVTGIAFDGCSFDQVDMSEARLSRSYIGHSRTQRAFVFPALPSGFAIDFQAYRAVVEELAPLLSDPDGAALRQELKWRTTNPPAEVLMDDETLKPLSADGRAKAMVALFERRLVRRG